jgi:hypothetical protein
MRKAFAVLGTCALLVSVIGGGCTTASPTSSAPEAVPTATTGTTETPTVGATATTASTSASDPPTATPTTALGPAWQADGVIGADEYARTTQAARVTFHWTNDDQFLYAAVSAETEGWVSVGLDPENRMQGANFIFGYVQGGETSIADMYGTEPTAMHPPDEELGGTNDIVAFGGREEGGTTTIEFQIPLDSGDANDKPLSPGSTYSVILARGTADEFLVYHAARGVSEITLD